jgi:hypothetical protein
VCAVSKCVEYFGRSHPCIERVPHFAVVILFAARELSDKKERGMLPRDD